MRRLGRRRVKFFDILNLHISQLVLKNSCYHSPSKSLGIPTVGLFQKGGNISYLGTFKGTVA